MPPFRRPRERTAFAERMNDYQTRPAGPTFQEYACWKVLGQPNYVSPVGELYYDCPRCGSDSFHTLPHRRGTPDRWKCWACPNTPGIGFGDETDLLKFLFSDHQGNIDPQWVAIWHQLISEWRSGHGKEMATPPTSGGGDTVSFPSRAPYARLLEKFGVSFVEHQGTLRADRCPYCGGQQFYLNLNHYHCNDCGNNGDHSTFLTDMVKLAFETTTADDYGMLADTRAIQPVTLRKWGLAYHYDLGCWLIPFRDAHRNVVSM